MRIYLHRFLLLLLLLLFSTFILGKTCYTVGISKHYQPFEFIDPSHHPAGIVPELLSAIAQNSDLSFKFLPAEMDNLLLKLKNGEIQILGSVVWTNAQKDMLYSLPHSYVHYGAFVRHDAQMIRNWQDLNEKHIIITTNDPLIASIHTYVKKPILMVTDCNKVALEKLSNGMGDAVILPLMAGYTICKEEHFDNLKTGGVIEDALPICFAVSQDKQFLIDKLNYEIYKLRNNQTIYEINRKWLSAFDKNLNPYNEKKQDLITIIITMSLLWGIIIVFHKKLGNKVRELRQFLAQYKLERNQLEKQIKLRHQMFLTGPIIFMKWIDPEKETFEYVSENFSAFGYKPDDIISGKIHYRNIIHPDDLIWILKERRKHIEENTTHYSQIYRIICPVNRSADNQNIFINVWHELNPVLANASTVQIRYIFDYTYFIPDEITKTSYFYGYLLDITHMKQNERDLLSQHQETQIAIHVKDAFLTRITSEINSPLNALIGLLRKLGSTGLNEEQLSIVQTISQSALNLKRILQQIHDFLSILKGSIGSEPQWYILKRLMEPIISEYRMFATKKQLTFSYSEYHPTQLVYLDQDWFQKIVCIVLDNAIKFTKHGNIDLTVDLINKDDNKHLLLVRISDTGIGIPQDMLKTILEPFTQVDETFTRNFGGIGLGLSIAKNLLLQMDGSLYIASSPEQGTTVELHFPVQLK